MTTYIGVLRAINIGSHNRIAMADLRAMLEKVGCEDPKTLIVSGNVVFRTTSASCDTVEMSPVLCATLATARTASGSPGPIPPLNC